MPTLKDVLPPPPHEVGKEFVDGAKGFFEDAKTGVKNVLDDGKAVIQELAPHKVLQDLKPSKEMLPPPPPKPPRLGD